jgi:dTDP-4-dehydrorhamnose 3,5-epimerase
MIFNEIRLPGAYVVELERRKDERGYFARTFGTDEFERAGLNPAVAQCSTSFNSLAGTVRGMHFQAPPHAECKLVRCTRGAIFDVIVDLRTDSPLYCEWFAIELTPDSGQMLYIPDGLAHGFQTLEDGTEVAYQISEHYSPSHALGVRWDDPVFEIQWPLAVTTISERDRSYPDFVP